MIRDKKSDITFRILAHTFLILLSVVLVVPLLSVIFISLTSEASIAREGYPFFLREIDLEAYKFVFKSPGKILNAYKVTLIVSFGGTFLYLLVSSMAAYALSRPNFRYAKPFTFYFFFTMLFSGGMVPSYILISSVLQLKDTYAALILPALVNVWYLIIMKTYMAQLPGEILESARIDGAGHWRTYLRFVLPLSKPSLATIGLLMLLDFWNSWMPAMLYINDKNMYPLQYLLQVMLRNIMEIYKDVQNNVLAAGEAFAIPTEGVRMAMCVMAVAPIIIIFPFFQRYFTKGLTVGAVKG